MRMKVFSVTLLTVSAVTSASAHVMVSPTVSMQGATQKYEVRVHNEANVAAAAVTVEIPDGVEVTEIADTPQGGHTVKKSGSRPRIPRVPANCGGASASAWLTAL